MLSTNDLTTIGVGEDSLDGFAGVFSGLIGASGYSAYTGSVFRTTTDIVVPCTKSAYGLYLKRTYISRVPILPYTGLGSDRRNIFGDTGWDYNYGISVNEDFQAAHPTQYGVKFGDGRTILFSATTGKPTTGQGAFERFQAVNWDIHDVNDPEYHKCYLLLPDGGKVKFQVTVHDCSGGFCFYTYTTLAIIDPFGLVTTLSYDPNTLIQTVTDPSGVSLKIYFLQIAAGHYPVIDHVTEYINNVAHRTVTYSYSIHNYDPDTNPPYLLLDSVNYWGLSQFTAFYQYAVPNLAYTGALLITAKEPLYPGPMKNIAYVYRRTGNNADGRPIANGQIQSELHWDGVSPYANAGPVVSTLIVGRMVNGQGDHHYRKEIRGDNLFREFTYVPTTGGLLGTVTDWMGHTATRTYDANGYVSSVIDFKVPANITNYTCNDLGKITQVKYPASSAVVPQPDPRGTVNLTYEASYYIKSITDEAGNTTTYTRDPTSHHITSIRYGDGGTESFVYTNGLLTSKTLRTGGVEKFKYDSLNRLWYYSDPYHNNPVGDSGEGDPDPSIPEIPAGYNLRLYYNDPLILDRVTGMYNVSGQPFNWAYDNIHNKLIITLPRDPNDNLRHTIVQVYNADGTLQSLTDPAGSVWSYTYDDYRRVRSVTSPGHDTAVTSTYFYDVLGTGNDYRYFDSKVTWQKSPLGKTCQYLYDANRRISTVIKAVNTVDQSSVVLGYDNNGNNISVRDPKLHIAYMAYDERNRLMSITDRLNQVVGMLSYDRNGHAKSIQTLNGQTFTNDFFDGGNRVTQQTVTSDPDPDAVTKYAYYDQQGEPFGLLKSIQDPKLVASGSTDKYTFNYDLMGRLTEKGFPKPVPLGAATFERRAYDIYNRLLHFTNRAGDILTLGYDNMSRVISASWDDGITPTASYTYDVLSRPLLISNANSVVTRAYYKDGLLRSENQHRTGGASRIVQYVYDSDGNRTSILYPGSFTYLYAYTNRNQVKTIGTSLTSPHFTYAYDVNGNLLTRTQPHAGVGSSTWSYDTLNRITSIVHAFNGTTKTITYGYDTSSNRIWCKRNYGSGNVFGDVFGYDLAEQITAVKLNILNPDITAVGSQKIFYDANGNRSTFSAYGSTDTYTANFLNQYSQRNATLAHYNVKGDMTQNMDGAVINYNALGQVRDVTKDGVTMSFAYDALGRQVTRTTSSYAIGNVYDGWDLIEEFDTRGPSEVLTAEYVYGPDGMALSYNSNRMIAGPSLQEDDQTLLWLYHFYNGERSASHVTDLSGNLQEWYRYDLQGAPFFYDANNNLLSDSNLAVRHLFTGQQWYKEIDLYDLRNRFYSPDIGRFVNPDPIGFTGGNNLYRYCGNDPIGFNDPRGLDGPDITYGGSDPNTGAFTASISANFGGIVMGNYANWALFDGGLGPFGMSSFNQMVLPSSSLVYFSHGNALGDSALSPTGGIGTHLAQADADATLVATSLSQAYSAYSKWAAGNRASFARNHPFLATGVEKLEMLAMCGIGGPAGEAENLGGFFVNKELKYFVEGSHFEKATEWNLLQGLELKPGVAAFRVIRTAPDEIYVSASMDFFYQGWTAESMAVIKSELETAFRGCTVTLSQPTGIVSVQQLMRADKIIRDASGMRLGLRPNGTLYPLDSD